MNVVSAGIDFVVKNSYTYFALSNFRNSLEVLVYEVARDTFIASHAAVVLSVPVTRAMGEISAHLCKESINAITELFCFRIFESEPFRVECPSGNPIGLVVGTLVKSYFCTFVLLEAAEPLKVAIRAITPLTPMAEAIVAVALPASTFFVGDFLQDSCKKW